MKTIFSIASIVCRVIALVLVALTLALCFMSATSLGVSDIVSSIQSMVPAPFLGSWVFETPFGGVFRGDFALLAVLFFVADWIFARLSAKRGV